MQHTKLFALFSVLSLSLIVGQASALDMGAKLPDVTLNDLQGKPVKIAALKGKVVVLDFWASWCGPCKEATPALDKIYKKYKDKGLVIVGVSVDREKDKITEFLKSTPASFTIVHDDGHKVADAVKPPKMPSSYVFGRDGSLKFIHEGYHSGDESKVEKEVADLLAEKAAVDEEPAPSAPVSDDGAAKGKKKKKGKK